MSCRNRPYIDAPQPFRIISYKSGPTSNVMSLEQDVAVYGRKGATLKYIISELPDAPIPPFALVAAQDDWRAHLAEIAALGHPCLVRSSSLVEDAAGASFAGLFETLGFHGATDVNDVLRSARNRDALTYAKARGIELPTTMGLIFQNINPSDYNWGLLRHPHMPHILFVQGRVTGSDWSGNLVYDEQSGEFQNVVDWECAAAYGESRVRYRGLDGVRENELDDLRTAIAEYRRIEALPAFQTNHTYHMEFGTDPFAVYQFRPFREKILPSWTLDFDDYASETTWPSKFGLAFGVTPKEGIELNVVRALALGERYQLIEKTRNAKEHQLDDLMDEWRLCAAERVYLTEMRKNTDWGLGRITDQALRWFKRRFEARQTLLFQGSIHFYAGEDIDLVFPNARAWVGHMGLKFLSHKWFRLAQGHEIALMGAAISGQTGDTVRVYCDGVRGAVVQTYDAKDLAMPVE